MFDNIFLWFFWILISSWMWSMNSCVHHSRGIWNWSSFCCVALQCQSGLNSKCWMWLTVTDKRSGRFLKGTKEPTVCTVNCVFMKALMATGIWLNVWWLIFIGWWYYTSENMWKYLIASKSNGLVILDAPNTIHRHCHIQL